MTKLTMYTVHFEVSGYVDPF